MRRAATSGRIDCSSATTIHSRLMICTRSPTRREFRSWSRTSSGRRAGRTIRRRNQRRGRLVSPRHRRPGKAPRRVRSPRRRRWPSCIPDPIPERANGLPRLEAGVLQSDDRELTLRRGATDPGGRCTPRVGVGRSERGTCGPFRLANLRRGPRGDSREPDGLRPRGARLRLRHRHERGVPGDGVHRALSPEFGDAVAHRRARSRASPRDPRRRGSGSGGQGDVSLPALARGHPCPLRDDVAPARRLRPDGVERDRGAIARTGAPAARNR